MLITFKCPACGNRMYEDHAVAGQIRQCPRCMHCVQVPKKEAREPWSFRWVIVGALVCVIFATVYWIYYNATHAY